MKTWLKKFLYSLLAFVLFLLVWYGTVRINAKVYPVKIYELDLPGVQPQREDIQTLRVGAYNIAHGRGGQLGASNWQKRNRQELYQHLDQIASQIKTENLDVVILNEVDFCSAWSYHVNQAEYIARKAGYRYRLEQVNMDVAFPFYRFRFGNSMLSRYPIRHATFIKFPALSKKEDLLSGNHDGVYCEIDTPKGPVGFFPVHLEYRDESVRVMCVKKIHSLAKEMTLPVLAVGDFNSSLSGMPKSAYSKSGENAISYLLDQGGFISYL